MTIAEAQKLLSPNPFALVTSLKEDGQTNIMALSWWMFVSNNAPTLAIATSSRGYTSRCIERTGEFGLCFAGAELKDQALLCGGCSGRNTDKANAFGIALMDARTIKPQLVRGCRVMFECVTQSTVSVEDHTVTFARIVDVHGDPRIGGQLYALDGYQRLDSIRMTDRSFKPMIGGSAIWKKRSL